MQTLKYKPACLVDALCNEVCWEALVEDVLVLKRVVELSVRHAARLEPAVKHLQSQ